MTTPGRVPVALEPLFDRRYDDEAVGLVTRLMELSTDSTGVSCASLVQESLMAGGRGSS